MTAEHKYRLFPGQKMQYVFEEVNGTKHHLATFFLDNTIVKNQVGERVMRGTQTLLETFLLRTELPNGDVIHY